MSPVEDAQQVFDMDPASTTDKREEEMKTLIDRLLLHLRRLMESIPDPGLTGTTDSAYKYGMYIELATKLVNTIRKEVMYALSREKGPTFADVNSLKQNIMRLRRILFGTWALLVQDYDLCLDIESEHGDSIFLYHLLPEEGLREN